MMKDDLVSYPEMSTVLDKALGNERVVWLYFRLPPPETPQERQILMVLHQRVQRIPLAEFVTLSEKVWRE